MTVSTVKKSHATMTAASSTQERPPRLRRPAWCGVNTGVFEDLPDSLCGDGDAESGKFAVDTAVSHVGFSRTNRMIRRRVSTTVDGRPGRCG